MIVCRLPFNNFNFVKYKLKYWEMIIYNKKFSNLSIISFFLKKKKITKILIINKFSKTKLNRIFLIIKN